MKKVLEVTRIDVAGEVADGSLVISTSEGTYSMGPNGKYRSDGDFSKRVVTRLPDASRYQTKGKKLMGSMWSSQ